jgi:S-adenosyl methyltransferase
MLIAVMHLIVDAEATRFFDGLELVEPGVAAVPRWRPGSAAEASAHSTMWGGAGRRA